MWVMGFFVTTPCTIIVGEPEIVTGRTAGVPFPAETRDFVYSTASRPTEAHPASYPMGIGDSFPVARMQEREASSELKNGGAIPPLPDGCLRGLVRN
jgi:hypothetical protein